MGSGLGICVYLLCVFSSRVVQIFSGCSEVGSLLVLARSPAASNSVFTMFPVLCLFSLASHSVFTVFRWLCALRLSGVGSEGVLAAMFLYQRGLVLLVQLVLPLLQLTSTTTRLLILLQMQHYSCCCYVGWVGGANVLHVFKGTGA